MLQYAGAATGTQAPTGSPSGTPTATGVASEAEAPTGATAGVQQQGVPVAAPLFVAVVDAKAQPVYVGTTAFKPRAGAATYQNIALAAGGKPLGDPPEAIRNVALPPSQLK